MEGEGIIERETFKLISHASCEDYRNYAAVLYQYSIVYKPANK